MSHFALHHQITVQQQWRDQGRPTTHRRHAVSRRQKQVVSVTAFKTQDETISIAFDGYNLLQVGQSLSRASP